MTTQPVEWNAGKPGGLDTSMSLTSGEETVPRVLCNSASTLANATVRAAVMRAKRTERITQVRMLSSTTAAVGITDAWMGVYEVVQQANGTWVANLVGITADDATLFSATSTPYTRALVTPFVKQAGRYYTVAALVAGATTSPTLVSTTMNVGLASPGASESAMSPPVNIQQSGVATLPAQLAIPGNITATPILFYGVMAP